MGFFRFLWKHLAPFGIVIGGAFIGYGYLSEGLELYRLGLPVWAWQIVGLVLVVGGLLVFVHRNQLPVPEPAAGPRSKEGTRRGDVSMAHFQITRAHTEAKMALIGREPNLAATVASAESALATIRRVFQVDTPQPTGDERADLRTWIDYFDVVWPFLQHGNTEMAQVKAINFITSRNLQIH